MPPATESEESWTLPDVYLLTDTKNGRVAVPHLRLELTPGGITLAKENQELAWSAEWAGLSELSTAEHSVLPDGSEGVVLVVVEQSGREHRFVLPTGETDDVERRLRDVAQTHRLLTTRKERGPSRSLTVAVVIAFMATLAVLLLSAAHVIHF
ncbi:MAG TPA: hypothetical protein VNG12_01085 [Acidimicrobiales bacterium]|nr:hypothetical protein [Acidimicrobiales bacterium]